MISTAQNLADGRRVQIEYEMEVSRVAIETELNGLFTGGPRIRLNACVGRNGGPALFDRYACGCFEAAASLVKGLKEDPRTIDTQIYPVVMICRQGVELSLKHLAWKAPRLRGLPSELKFTHRLTDNWNTARPHLVYFGMETEVDEIVTKYVNDIVEFDPFGEAFRFPTDRNNKLHLQELFIISAEVVGQRTEEVATCFDFLFNLIAAEEDMQSENEYATDWEGP